MTPDEVVTAAEVRAYGLRRAYLDHRATFAEWREAAAEARALRDERDAARSALTLVAGEAP